ncbi:MAG: hypothetical protein BAA02_00855 [Paenibacillaceae bacterium ZCTH02-B3]|nr:MAG: hypothetical protein BAA02_00855 [Paenibacillaceae bacterium ZCTH02-B3]
MSLDGLAIRALVHELQAWKGALITKIYQPIEFDLVLHLRGAAGTGRLLVSANPSLPRMHLTERTRENPQEPPMFCMLLRKHCEGGAVEAIRQRGLERIVEIDIRHRNELGDPVLKRLVVELTGRNSNIILLDPASGTIHDAIRRVTPAISSYRTVLPGGNYVPPPPQNKRDPLEESETGFREAMGGLPADGAPADLERTLVGAYAGIGPLLAREIVHRAGGKSAELWNAFRAVMRDAADHRYHPVIVHAPDGKTVFSVFDLTHLTGDKRSFPGVQACMETYFRDKAEREYVRQRTAELVRVVSGEIARNERRIARLRETLEEAREADKYRRYGELLTAHLHAVTRGDERAEVVDYYDEAQPVVSIPLDPQLSPSENAQRYFRKYAKLKNSVAAATKQLEEAEAEIRYLESVLQALETAGPEDIAEIREELAAQGYIRGDRPSGAGGKNGKKKNGRPAVLSFVSSEGVPILVGKNNTQNDYLTCRLAAPGDTWLHAKDIPGSHVVIRGSSFGEATLREAAMLAAYYSRARHSGNVPVDYTLIRHVRKPSGARPGFVIYDRHKTLFVTPDEAVIRDLAASSGASGGKREP